MGLDRKALAAAAATVGAAVLMAIWLRGRKMTLRPWLQIVQCEPAHWCRHAADATAGEPPEEEPVHLPSGHIATQAGPRRNDVRQAIAGFTGDLEACEFSARA